MTPGLKFSFAARAAASSAGRSSSTAADQAQGQFARDGRTGAQIVPILPHTMSRALGKPF